MDDETDDDYSYTTGSISGEERVYRNLESNTLSIKESIFRSRDPGFQTALAFASNTDWIAEASRLTSDLESCLAQIHTFRVSFEQGVNIDDNYPRYTGQCPGNTYREQVRLLRNGIAYLIDRFERLHSRVAR